MATEYWQRGTTVTMLLNRNTGERGTFKVLKAPIDASGSYVLERIDAPDVAALDTVDVPASLHSDLVVLPDRPH